MEIKFRRRIENKTSRYLSPCLLYGYGKTLILKVRELFILSWGLGDTLINSNPVYDFTNRHPIFFLIDTAVNKRKAEDFLHWIKYQEYFLYSYPADTSGRSHMVILDFPEKYSNAYDKFLEGKYSEMFTKEDICSIFSSESKEFKVLMKDRVLLSSFVNEVKKVFCINNLNGEDFKDAEMELPYTVNKKEEFFNYQD